MTTGTLRIIYYALSHSTISYEIIAWGDAYTNSKSLLNRLQIRLLEIINKYKFTLENNPMSLDQIFHTNHCPTITKNYSLSLLTPIVQLEKSIQIPRGHLTISTKNNYIRAIMQVNNLPKELKTVRQKDTKKMHLNQRMRGNTEYNT